MKRWNFRTSLQTSLRTNLQLKFLVMGLWLVLMALGLRLVGNTAAGMVLSRLNAQQLWTLVGECLGARAVTAETASERVDQPEKPPQSQTRLQAEPQTEPVQAPVSQPLSFERQEADAIAIGGSAESTVDKASLLLTPLELRQEAEPLILIVHTHTSEAYTPEAGWDYVPTDAYRTRDPNYNMIRVGAELSKALEARGIAVIHDTTVHDDPQYRGAYDRSYDTIAAALAAHPSIQIVLDLHRDAAEDEEGNALPRQTTVDGVSCAQLMLVVGTEEGGLHHPNWEENLSFALKLQALMNRDAPTLCRDLSLRQERFNQHFTPCSLLIEVGAAGNTLAQALAATPYLAQALASLVQQSPA